ncbi:MAG: hypothetical protein IJ298_02955 [Ruminococcus sp.]|nr:hypothetical protein [Ruminococcus sp.]
MDINKDEILDTEAVSEEVIPVEEPAEDAVESSTLDVTQEDIDEEMARYGVTSRDECEHTEEQTEEYTAPEKKKGFVQMPILITAVAILITTIIISGVVLVYNGFFKPGISGAYVLADAADSGTYFVFDKDGNVAMDGGGIRYFGTYTMDKVDGVDVISSDFYFIASYGGQATVTYTDNKNTMTFTFAAGSLNFIKTKLPDHEVDPQNITHASADELGITEPNIVDGVIGTWTEEMYGTYTFNADGTGSYLSEYSYSEYMGYGLGMEYKFKYTVYEDEILITLDYYGGQKEDGTFTYYLDKGNLVLNGVGYTKVDK